MSVCGGNGRLKVLLVDDEERHVEMYGALLEEEGYSVVTAGSGGEAREALRREGALGLAVLDLRLPDVEGLELFHWFRKHAPALPVIILTGYGSVESAVQALREGAYHYLTKPPEVEQWRAVVRAAARRTELEMENACLRKEVHGLRSQGGLVGRSRPMLDIYQWIQVVGPSRSTTLINGESGTGKELAARALHGAGPRSDAPFVGVNCGALPPNLLESELFGHERGAFTGALQAKAGLFELAEGGTIFLDEIGDCPPELQVRLLRVLQEKEVRRVGGSSSRSTDFRMIAATNRSLDEEVRQGRFREDLYYRVNVISFTMPPLRERMEDLPLLAAQFLNRYAVREGRDLTAISGEALELLMEHDWPGNVRELENVVERGVVVSSGARLEAADLPPHLRRRMGEARCHADFVGKDYPLREIEKVVIAAALDRHGGNKSRTARVLGISRKLLYSKIGEYGL